MGKIVLGIDVGGTGVKAALVNTKTGELTSEKIKYATPQPSYPLEVMKVINQLVDDFKWRGKKTGCGFPSIIKNSIIYSAANIDNSWMHINLDELFQKEGGLQATFINDADAAGLAEMKFGAGQGVKGTVLMLTLGTGIGSGLFLNQKLVPNTEFGHLEHKESVWEHYASNSAREKKELGWEEWGAELNAYLHHVDLLINPDLIILGGGVSKKFEEYQQYIDVTTPVVQAKMMNNAGIIGAAMSAKEKK
jgi:polyphosphate glucokinase